MSERTLKNSLYDLIAFFETRNIFKIHFTLPSFAFSYIYSTSSQSRRMAQGSGIPVCSARIRIFIKPLFRLLSHASHSCPGTEISSFPTRPSIGCRTEIAGFISCSCFAETSRSEKQGSSFLTRSSARLVLQGRVPSLPFSVRSDVLRSLLGKLRLRLQFSTVEAYSGSTGISAHFTLGKVLGRAKYWIHLTMVISIGYRR